MHEFSIVSNLVKTLRAELRKSRSAGKRVLKVRLVVGRLHAIVPESFDMAYEALTSDTPLAGSKLVLEFRPVIGLCRACGWTGEVAGPFFKCDACESGDVEITGGRELHLDSMEVEDDEHKDD